MPPKKALAKDLPKGSEEVDDVSVGDLNMVALDAILKKYFTEAEERSKDRFDRLEAQLGDINTTLQKLETELESQKQLTSSLQVRIKQIEDSSCDYKSDLTKLQNKIAFLEDQQRRNNIRIFNLKEGIELDHAPSYLKENLPVWFPELADSFPEMTRARRVGRGGGSASPRSMLVSFFRAADRDRILTLSRSSQVTVAGRMIRFAADYSDETARKRRRCFPVLNHARALGLKVFLLYPANIKLIRGSEQHFFSDPVEAEKYLNLLDPTAVTGGSVGQ